MGDVNPFTEAAIPHVQPANSGTIVPEAASNQTETTQNQHEPALKPSEDPKDLRLRQQFVALTKKEREILQRQQALSEREKRVTEWEEKKKNAKSKPLDWLKEGDLDLDYLTSYVLNDNKPTESMEVKELRTQLEQVKKEIAERDAKAKAKEEELVIREFKSDMTHFIKSAGEKYELIQANDAYETVYNVINLHYEQTGKIMSFEDASNRTEAWLEGQAQQDYEKLSKLKKLQAKLNLSKAEEKSESSKDEDGFASALMKPKTIPGSQAERPKTLTNQVSIPTRSERRLTREESLAEAAKLLRWHD